MPLAKPDWADLPPDQWPSEVKHVLLLNAIAAERRMKAEAIACRKEHGMEATRNES